MSGQPGSVPKRQLSLPMDRPAADDTTMNVRGEHFASKQTLKPDQEEEGDVVRAIERLQIKETAAQRASRGRKPRHVSATEERGAAEAVGSGRARGTSFENGAESRSAMKRPTRGAKRALSADAVLVRCKERKVAHIQTASTAGDHCLPSSFPPWPMKRSRSSEV